MDAPRTVWRNLRHWTLHVCLSASGCFVAAYLTDWHSAQAVTGMIGGIALFVVLYTWVWSSPWFQRRVPTGGTLDRALLYATRLRSIIGIYGLLFGMVINALSGNATSPSATRTLVFYLSIPFLPDILAGLLSGSFIESIGKSSFVRALRTMVAGPDAHQRAQSMLVGNVNSLLPTFLLTVAQGILLSLMLLALAWLCEVVLLYRARRRLVAPPNAVPPL